MPLQTFKCENMDCMCDEPRRQTGRSSVETPQVAPGLVSCGAFVQKTSNLAPRAGTSMMKRISCTPGVQTGDLLSETKLLAK